MTRIITPPHNLNESKKHYYWLDVLRFAAAFLVMAGHFRGDFFEEYALLPENNRNLMVALFYLLTRLGHEAVLIFFVLSGFLVGGKSIERLSLNTFNLTDYVVDRTTRIMLPLISALLLYIPVTYLVGSTPNWSSWAGNLLSLQGVVCGPIIGPLWSLSYEVWFYILIAAVAMTTSQYYRYWGAMLLLVVTLVFAKLSPIYLFVWLMGAMAYRLMPTRGSTWVLSLSCILFLISMGLLQLTREGHVAFSASLDLNRQMLELLFGFCSCLVIQQLVLCKPTSRFSLALNRLGTKLAAFSYTMYLVHPMIQRVLVYYGAPKSETITLYSLFLYLVWLCIGLIGSYLVYLLFERNTSQCKVVIKQGIARCRAQRQSISSI